MNNNDIETVIVQDFWEEHIEKSQDDYDPYHYIDDMNLTQEEMLIDFNWDNEEEDEENYD